MVDATVGEAWVNLVPSGRGFSKKAQQELAAIDLDKSVNLEADATKLKAGIAAAKQELDRLSREKANPSVDFDVAVAEAKIEELKAKLEDLGKQTVTPKVTTQIAEAERDLAKVERQLADLNARKASVDVDADIAAAQAHIAQLEGKLTEVDARRAEPIVLADTSQATGRLTEVNAELQRLSAVRAHPAVELQIAQARQQSLLLRGELDRLGALRPSPHVDADIAAASAKLAVLKSQLAQIDNTGVSVSVDSGEMGGAASIASALAAALAGVGAAAPAAVAGLAAAARSAGAFAQGAGAALMGFSGIGDALTAVEGQQKSAATSGTQAASQQQSSMKQIASAARSLQQAQIQQSRTAIQGAQQVASAQRALAAAQVAADRAAITGAQQVASARRALASAQIQAARSVEDAQRSYTRSVDQERFAQESVTQARRDATRALEDLQLQQSGAALSQERAAINLEKAQERMAAAQDAGMPEGRGKQELSLDVREAQQALAETQNRYKNLSEDAADFARTGVEGSDQVVQAQRSLQATQDAVADSARQLSRAQFDGAQQVQEAQIALGQAIQQAGWAQEDAARGVADAQIALGQAQQQAQWANEDAARAVEDAQRALADAYQSAGAAGVAGADASAYALSKLSPAGREFVRFMTEEWQPTWEKTSHAVAEELLPRVEKAMRNVLALEPLVRAGMTESARVIGDLAVKGSELATSAPFKADFASIMSSNNRQLESFGNAGINLFGAFTDLYTVAGPVAERFSRLAEYSSDAFESWVIGARQTGDLDRYLQNAGDTLMWLGGVLWDVGSDFLTVAGNLAPLGYTLVEIIRGVSNFAAGVTTFFGPAVTSIVTGAGLAVVAASKLGTAMSGLAFARGATGISGFANVLGTVFNPAALYATRTVQGLGLGAATMASKVGVGASAALNFGNGVSRVASALPLVGAAIIGVTLAYDGLNTSTTEAADALLQGGQAATDMRGELVENDAAAQQVRATYGDSVGDFREWINGMTGAQTTTAQANAEVQRRIDVMSPLQAAQARATLAQTDYETALRETGPTSDRTRDAQTRLAQATNNVEQAQADARRATMDATQALKDQQDQILGSIDSRLRLEQSVRGVQRAQDDYARAVHDSGFASLDAQDAYGRLQEAQSQQAASARKAAEDQAHAKGITDASAQSNDAFARSVGDMVARTQGELTPALTTMVNSLNNSQLAAAGATVKFNAAGQAVATFPNGKTVILDANTSPVYPALQAVKLAVDSTRGTVGVDADPTAGVMKVGGFKLQTDATRGVVTIDGNISPADQQRLGIQAKTDGTTGTMFINGNPVPADGQLNGMRVRVDGTTGVMTIDGNPRPATDQGQGAANNISGQRPVMPVQADTTSAWDSIWAFIRGIPSAVMRIEAGIFSTGGPVGRASGGVIEPQGYSWGGAIIPPGTRGYAQGAAGSERIPKSDTVPAMLTPGEFVVRKRAVDAIGVPALMAINGMAIGGPVVPPPRTATLGMALGGGVPAPRISGMAGGRMSSPVGFATGGTAPTINSVAMSTHRYDNATRIVSQTAAGPEAQKQAAAPLVGEYHSHFHGTGVTAGDAMNQLDYRLRLSRSGGAHR